MKKLICLIITALAFASCSVEGRWENPNDPYEDYYGRMIDRIRIDYSTNESNYIYYDYDRRGRITTIESTYYQTIDRFFYGENKYGDEIITINNNLGDDRDIILDWNGYAEAEIAYDKTAAIQEIEYDYKGGKLWGVEVKEYNDDSSLFSEESYEFDFDYNDNLRSVGRSYDEYNYYVDSELIFSSFSNYENNYNVDILSILGLYIDDDFASHIGRTGERSRYLPTYATLRINRNGRYDKDVNFRINYIGKYGRISAIEISSSLGMREKYYFTFLN